MASSALRNVARFAVQHGSSRVGARGLATQLGPALIHEVTPRDGLQNEKSILSLEQKLGLVQRLIDSNPASIELASFVRPDLIPAMADGVDLCLALNDQDWAQAAKARGMHFAGLVPNMRGYETLLKARGGREDAILDTVVCIVSCSDTHSKANVRKPLEEALEETCKIIENAKEAGLRVQAYASLAFGCPFEGDVDPAVVQRVVEKYVARGADVVVLADTLGVGKPEQVKQLVTAALESVPADKLALHMHDTHGRAQESIEAGVALGVRRFDSATGGCGGCNFVPDAKGNISTQQVLAVLESMQIEHGMDWTKLQEAHTFLEGAVGHGLDSSALYNR